MAVTVTVDEVARAIRAVDSAEVAAELGALLAFARGEVVRIAPRAPDLVHGRAAILAVGYLYDKPTAARGVGFANVFRNSGAIALLAPYRIHRAGSTAKAIATRGGFSKAFSKAFDVVRDR